MKLSVTGPIGGLMLAGALIPGSALADSDTDFEPAGFAATESVDNHMPDGTEASPPIDFTNNCVQAWFVPTVRLRPGSDTDEEVVDISGADSDHGKVWRMSSAFDPGALGNNPHSANSGDVSGETGAANDAGCGPPTTADFYAEFEFRSATGAAQPDHRTLISANSGDQRHGFVDILDNGVDGFDLGFFEAADGCIFPFTQIASSLAYDAWHKIGIEIFFVDGLAAGTAGSSGAVGNDVVNIYLDGALIHSGTSSESCVGAQSVDRLLFETRNEDAGFAGAGLYFDNVLVTDVCPEGECNVAVGFDIKPRGCRNPLASKARGVLPAAILGTSDFDVTELDPSTVSLEGVPPLRFNFEDVATPFEPLVGKEDPFDCTNAGPDGETDMTLKFDNQAIIDALGPLSRGDVLVLELNGELMDGTPVVGEDVVVVVN